MKIFAYIDRSSFFESVWQHAVWAAKQLNAAIELVHALDHPVSGGERDYSGYVTFGGSESALEQRMRLDEAHNRLLIDEGRMLLDSVADRIRSAGIPAVTQRLYQGTVVEHLAEHAHDALLVVVGKRGEGANQDPQHLGRNIERLVRSAHKPVLIAAEAFVPFESATIAFDGGKSSGEAIHFVAAHPLLRNLHTRMIHIASDDHVPAAVRDAREHLLGANIEVDVEMKSGDVAEALLADSRQSDLLIIGAFGHSRIRHLVVGSTTIEILIRTESSVLVIH